MVLVPTIRGKCCEILEAKFQVEVGGKFGKFSKIFQISEIGYCKIGVFAADSKYVLTFFEG